MQKHDLKDVRLVTNLGDYSSKEGLFYLIKTEHLHYNRQFRITNTVGSEIMIVNLSSHNNVLLTHIINHFLLLAVDEAITQNAQLESEYNLKGELTSVLLRAEGQC